MHRSLAGAGLAIVAFAVACSSNPGGVADNSHGHDASGGFAGSASGSGGSGGAAQSDASAGSGGMSTGGSAGAGGSGGGAPQDLCTDPVGNLLLHGTFEEGMQTDVNTNVDVPANWQIRNPAEPAACAGSGTPAQHIFLSAPPTGCTGNALAIDARGQWDCIAIQRASDYNTIQGGATYRISADVRAQGNAVNPKAWFVLGAQWLDAQDQFFGDIKNPPTTTAADNDYDWKVLAFDVVAPANATRILVWLSAHYPGRVDYDNISVVKL